MSLKQPIVKGGRKTVVKKVVGVHLPLLPPDTLSAAVDDTSGGIELTASEVSGADSYSYYYAIDGGAWQSAATGQTTSYTFTPSEAGEYSFGVSAVKGSAESAMTTLVPGSLFDDVPNSEGISLMAFAEATGVDAWAADTNWMTDSTVGNWYGVTVSGGAVTAIDLSSNNLNGDVGTTLDDLTLTSLDLTGNTLTGKILIDPSPATLYLATADGEAMFFPSSGDYSGYAGALGATDHKFTFKDSADVEAVGYAAAAGGGETLGSELVTNGDFSAWTGDDPDGWTVSTETAAVYVTEHVDGAQYVSDGSSFHMLYQTLTSQVGRLYKGSYVFNSVVAGSYFTIKWREASTNVITKGIEGNVSSNYYVTAGTTDPTLRIEAIAGSTSDGVVESYIAKPLTDIPATGLRLVSAEDGSTRNMASTGTDFDPNNIATIEIEAL